MSLRAESSGPVTILHRKDCRLCFQPIDERALVCPYCHASQRRKRFPATTTIAVAASVIAIAAVALTLVALWRLELVVRELEVARADLEAMSALVEPPPMPTALPERVTSPAPAPQRVNRGDTPAFVLHSARLQAAWELLRYCDRVTDEGCEWALAEFKRHLPDRQILQCEEEPLGSHRWCWIALE